MHWNRSLLSIHASMPEIVTIHNRCLLLASCLLHCPEWSFQNNNHASTKCFKERHVLSLAQKGLEKRLQKQSTLLSSSFWSMERGLFSSLLILQSIYSCTWFEPEVKPVNNVENQISSSWQRQTSNHQWILTLVMIILTISNKLCFCACRIWFYLNPTTP